ncbi:MAG: FG-GAP repeat domain-containing protein [Verrucomicrobiaceae bacterium]
MKSTLRLASLALLCPVLAFAKDLSFKKITITRDFWGEGAHFADFDHDGNNDICCGPFVWWGPEFKVRTAYSSPKPDRAKPVTDAEYGPNYEAFIKGEQKPYDGEKGYSDYFLSYAHDFNSDGWSDIVVFSWPGDITAWYENPGKRDAGAWKRHIIFGVTDNESPALGDMNGDGKPELVCHTGGRLGYASLDWSDPTKEATYRAITKPDIKRYFRYTHGYGFGDINGDGKADILDKDGWREQPAQVEGDAEWVFHAKPFAPEGARGGSQMQVYDVNGDGLNDVIAAWDGHGYGLAWYEQKKDGSFTQHQLMGSKPEDSPHGVKFSQLHATTMADIDGDGVLDFITGKRRWAHGPNKDEEPGAAPVLYWFQIKRDGKGGADFIPHQIDDDSGVGTQVSAGDVNKDGKQDVMVGNKSGVFVFLQE